MDDESQHTLTFDLTNLKKTNLSKLYSNNIFELVNDRIEKAKNASSSTILPPKSDSIM